MVEDCILPVLAAGVAGLNFEECKAYRERHGLGDVIVLDSWCIPPAHAFAVMLQGSLSQKPSRATLRERAVVLWRPLTTLPTSIIYYAAKNDL